MGERAGSFNVGLKLQTGEVEITVGTETRTDSVSWGGRPCYFKAGVYVQSGTHSDFPVKCQSLVYTDAFDTPEKLASARGE